MSLKLLKEQAMCYIARKYVNDRYGDYGTMTRLEIDRQKKTIHIELDLKGEPETITVDVRGYELLDSSGKTMLRLGDISVSRDWMNIALEQWAQNRQFEIPDFLRVLL